MSMTKRYLESLPQAEQDAILGGIDNGYVTPDRVMIIDDAVNSFPIHESDDEWTDSAENEPTDEELAEWGRMLMEEDDEPVEAEDEELYDPLVKCRICRASRPISQMNTNGECPPCVRETALMVKPQGKCVTLEDQSGVEWKL